MVNQNIYYNVFSCDPISNYYKKYKREKWALKKADVMKRAGLELVIVEKIDTNKPGIQGAWMFTQND